MKTTKCFASDNNSGIHPTILKAIKEANYGHTIGYGDDPITQLAIKKFKEIFGNAIDVYFVFTGTAANVLGIKSCTQPYNSIICSDVAHLNIDECGAPEKFTGCKLMTITTNNGKIYPDAIKPYINVYGNPHHSQPKVISITQSTELGTVYTKEEIKALSNFAHNYNMILHMDGARISNACASLKTGFREITRDAGVDILSFGGTKNGMMIGEAIIFFDKKLSQNFKYIHKQGMHLLSKMRFISSQFLAYFSDDLWLKNAEHANKMAKLLEGEIEKIPNLKITQKVEANAVFVTIPKKYIPIIQKKSFFYIWNEAASEVRFMTSFDTGEEDVYSFVKIIKDTIMNDT